jgi:hypothetical protein
MPYRDLQSAFRRCYFVIPIVKRITHHAEF